jgi:hypothetical protein
MASAALLSPLLVIIGCTRCERFGCDGRECLSRSGYVALTVSYDSSLQQTYSGIATRWYILSITSRIRRRGRFMGWTNSRDLTLILVAVLSRKSARNGF